MKTSGERADLVPGRNGPLDHLDEWDAFVKARYAALESTTSSEGKQKEEFRNFATPPRDSVREFYRLNHRYQTRDFVKQKKREYFALDKRKMGIWEAMEFLNALVDDSDPDTDLSQIQHLLQTSEAIRGDGQPRWFILAGLIHDLGKILCLLGEPQWAVVGDTFPVGCAFSESIVFHEFFADNPDSSVPEYQTECGVYEQHCGLDRVDLSWGHDEYLHHVVKDYLPEEALYMIRYHSFYPAHKEGAYTHLMNDRDRKMFAWVRAFSQYDLYSKDAARPDVNELRPCYEKLIAEFFPPVLRW